jgi:hypothetical protein
VRALPQDAARQAATGRLDRAMPPPSLEPD